jgi:hypothetical protein
MYNVPLRRNITQTSRNIKEDPVKCNLQRIRTENFSVFRVPLGTKLMTSKSVLCNTPGTIFYYA